MNTSPERENSNGSQTKKTFFSPLFRVTTVSKYFALLIFIAAPFFGGYVGYQIGHERNELSDSRISTFSSTVVHQNELEINIASLY